ncbi:MAG TPA: GTPase domain-containing protein [Polyangiaceae bacterium]|jgi:signal recognition particle receptor subunit beta|nr:GTPase domain-containing protein [Polyangiaceae bacterium]
MPVVNPLARELVFKVVYYGPGLGGKTTSLQYVHATAKPEHRGKMVSLATPVDRTLYFDFLPIRVPHVRGMNVKLQLFTVPGQVHYNATRKLVLTGADGIVLVYDSQSARADANLETLDNLRDNLSAHGRTLSEMPHIVQYNKRDLYDVLPLDELDRQLNRAGAPSFATVATSGEGVYESLEAITRAVLDDFERRVPGQRGVEPTSLELPEGGLVEALRRAEDSDAWGNELAARAARAVQRHPSGVMLLSEVPEADVGEAAARAVAHEPQADEPRVVTPPPVAPSPAPKLESEPPPDSESGLARRVPPMSEPPPVPRLSSVPPPHHVSEDETGVSFELLWPPQERGTVRELEASIAQGDLERGVTLADQLVARALASAATLLGGNMDAPRDPSTVALLLGLEGRRYLEFRALVRDVRSGRGVSAVDALSAYAMAIEVRLARARTRSHG